MTPLPLTREQDLELQRNTAIKENSALLAQLAQVTAERDTWNDNHKIMCRVEHELRQQLAKTTAERDALKEEVEVGLQISGSFFSALKPILTSVNIQNPGQHITDLIAQLAQMTAERDAFIIGGVTEGLLRKHDGHVKIGKGCCVTLEDEWLEHKQQLAERDATIENLQLRVATVSINNSGASTQPKEEEPGYAGGGWIPCEAKEKP